MKCRRLVHFSHKGVCVCVCVCLRVCVCPLCYPVCRTPRQQSVLLLWDRWGASHGGDTGPGSARFLNTSPHSWPPPQPTDPPASTMSPGKDHRQTRVKSSVVNMGNMQQKKKKFSFFLNLASVFGISAAVWKSKQVKTVTGNHVHHIRSCNTMTIEQC